MRVGIVAESFLPNVNGVTNSVLRVLEHLKREGHEAMVVAPGARDFQDEIPDYLGFNIVRVPTVMVPLVDSLPIGVPTTTVAAALSEFKPDIIHLASPFVLGGAGVFAARQLGVPAVALYQTDVAGFATKYHLPMVANLAWDWTRTIHNMSEMTLAPSSSYIRMLESHGINNVRHWGRGVDTELFNPAKRSDVLRRMWDPTGEKKIVGFVGRLAAEKSVHRLAPLVDDPAVQLVIVGDGPERDCLAETLPSAVFTGALSGEELARAYASLDLFVHTGEFETFCQAIQEAQASGVPTTACCLRWTPSKTSCRTPRAGSSTTPATPPCRPPPASPWPTRPGPHSATSCWVTTPRCWTPTSARWSACSAATWPCRAGHRHA